MTRLTQAIQMPVMHGSLAGVIPEMRYRRQTLAMDGALVVSVFDGEVRASSVQLIEPFGRSAAPARRYRVKQLDLELLTRTFDFGRSPAASTLACKVSSSVHWQPVRSMRALPAARARTRSASVKGRAELIYARGWGAAAAIQRSFLRFFEQFGYERIGLRCVLVNGVCERTASKARRRGT